MIHITPEDKIIILKILNDFFPGQKYLVFGSRFRGDHQPFSDIDIAIVSDKPISIYDKGLAIEQFQASLLTYSVDLIDYHHVSENFRNIIDQGNEELK